MKAIGAMVRLRARRKAKLEEKRAASFAAKPVVMSQVDPAMLEGMRKQVEDAQVMATTALKAPKLVRSGRAGQLKAEADQKEAVLVKMEEAPVIPIYDAKVALNVYDHALVILSVGAETLNINKGYAIVGAAAVAALYFLAEKQGWIDFINF